jgi:hypothetical protein
VMRTFRTPFALRGVMANRSVGSACRGATELRP